MPNQTQITVSTPEIRCSLTGMTNLAVTSATNVKIINGNYVIPITATPYGVGVPTGGTTDQALLKSSDANFDTYWADIATQEELDAIATRVATNEEDIATNAGNISTNAEDIATNASNISTNADNINTLDQSLQNHEGDTTNPHEVTKLQVGLGNVDDTSDADKPISDDTQEALDDITNTFVDTKDPTGFIDNDTITVTYDQTARTITVTQPDHIYYYFNGIKKELGTAGTWTSDPHPVGDCYFLYSTDGITFAWSLTAWEFYHIQVAYIPCDSVWAQRECHGYMQWVTHEVLHETVGCYVDGSGLTLDPATYELQPLFPTDATNTPGTLAGQIQDEDLHTTIPAWAEGTYTQVYFTGTGTINYDTAAPLICRTGTTYPLINTVTAGTFAEVETKTKKYLNYYYIHIPVTSDAGSQLYRQLIIQPQVAYTSEEAALAEDFRTVNLGDLATLTPEIIVHAVITLATSASYSGATGRVRIHDVRYLTGSKASQVSIGGYNPTTAENVSFNPTAEIASTNVQAAIVEVEAAKQATLVSGTNIKTINSESLLGSGNLVIDYSDDIATLQNNIAMTNFYLASSNALSVLNFDDGITDDYQDSTGIDTITGGSRTGGSVFNYTLDANTLRLYHLNGTNGSTTITEEVSSANNGTCGGDTTLSTADYKYSPSSAIFNRTGTLDWIRAPHISQLTGTNDWTIELYFKALSTSVYHGLFTGSADTRVPSLMMMNNNRMGYFLSTTGYNWNTLVGDPGIQNGTGSHVLTSGTWYHVAFCRSGANVYGWIDGVADMTYNIGSTTSLYDWSSYLLQLGTWGNNTNTYALNGYIDEVRVSDYARYTTAFTPPAAPFSLAGTPDEMELLSTSQAAYTNPSTARIITTIVTDGTINTDVIFSVSSDGTNYYPVTLAAISETGDNVTYAGEVTLTVTEDELTYEVETTDTYEVEIKSTGLFWS